MLQFFENLKVIPLRKILSRGDAVTGQIDEREFDGLAALVMARLGNHRVHRRLRFLTQNAGGGTGVIAINLSALGIARGEGEAGEFEGARVGQADVSVDALRVTRMTAAPLVDIPARRQSPDGPESFVPTFADDPFARLGFVAPCKNAIAEFVEGLHTH